METSKLATSTCPLRMKLQKISKSKKHTQKSFNHLSLDYKLSFYLPELKIHWLYFSFVLRTICHENSSTYLNVSTSCNLEWRNEVVAICIVHVGGIWKCRRREKEKRKKKIVKHAMTIILCSFSFKEGQQGKEHTNPTMIMKKPLH